MSILIKGMEMPKHCRNCKFSYFTHGISMKCLFISEACKIKGRLSDCPLVEVSTPHGRLIDADEYGANYIIDFDKNPLEVLESTPTIIEAEVSE